MVFNVARPKPPRWEDKNLFELPNDSMTDAGSFEVDEDFIKKEKDLITYEKQMKEAKKKEQDLFSLPKEEPFEDEKTKDGDSYSIEKETALEEEKEEDLYKVPEEEIYSEINDDLSGEQVPIKVMDKDKLNVEANGRVHVVTRKDLYDYQKKYANESGEQGNEVTRYREFASIHGDQPSMDKLAEEVKTTFSKVDSRFGGFETMESEY